MTLHNALYNKKCRRNSRLIAVRVFAVTSVMLWTLLFLWGGEYSFSSTSITVSGTVDVSAASSHEIEEPTPTPAQEQGDSEEDGDNHTLMIILISSAVSLLIAVLLAIREGNKRYGKNT